jgi:hypothetical protein
MRAAELVDDDRSTASEDALRRAVDIEELKRAEFYLREGELLAHMGSWAPSDSNVASWSSLSAGNAILSISR